MRIAKIKIPEPGSEEKYPGCFNRDTLRLSQVFWKEITEDEYGSLTDIERMMFEFFNTDADSEIREAIRDGKTVKHQGFPIKLMPEEKQVDVNVVELLEIPQKAEGAEEEKPKSPGRRKAEGAEEEKPKSPGRRKR